MRRKPLKVGVIGCGGIAQMMHLPFLAERPDLFSIEAVCDASQQTVEPVAEQYGVLDCYTDMREMLEMHEELEAALVLSGGSHKEAVLACLKRGLHVFVEKPLGDSLAEVKAVEKALRGSDKVLMVAYHKRYDPAYPLVVDEVRRLEDLRYVSVHILHPVDGRYRLHHRIAPPLAKEALRRMDSEKEDGLDEHVRSPAVSRCLDGIVGRRASFSRRVAAFLAFQSLIHDVNALRGILGDPEGVLFTEVWHRGRALHTLLRMRNDVRCSVSWIYLPGLMNYEETLAFYAPERRVTLAFPSPYLRHFPSPVTVEEMESGRYVRRDIRCSYDEAFRRELLHFHDCVRKGRAPQTGLQDALADSVWLEKIVKAYKE